MTHTATPGGGLSVTHDLVTLHPGLPQRVLCLVYLLMVPFAHKSVLFWKVDQLVSISLIKLGLNSILDLPQAACSFSTGRLIGMDSPPATCPALTPRLLPPACNCSGHSERCVFDPELFRSTGHGGRCLHCRDHTAGPHCQRCRDNFYRWNPQTPCQPCDCHPAGEWAPLPRPLAPSHSGPCCPVPFLPRLPAPPV